MGDPAAHAIFAPSASERWFECPGSIQMSVGCPPQEDTTQAIEGTDGHYLGQKCLEHNVDAMVFVGRKLPSGERVSAIMARHIQKYLEYVRKYHYYNGGDIYVEQRVYMSKIDPRFWGSADVIQVTKYQTIHIFDLKYGLYLVEAEKNKQMMSYAVGALTKYGHLVDVSKGVCAHICQPRPEHKDGQFRSVLFSFDELVEFGNQAREKIAEADGPNPTIKEGEHCFFCPAEFICPVRNSVGRKVFTR